MCHPLGSLIVMATVQQKVGCILWLTEFKFITCVRRKFQFVCGGSAPSCNSIKKWDSHLRHIGSVINQKSLGHPVKTRNRCFLHSPHKALLRASRQLHLPHFTIHDVHKHLHLHAYTLQLWQHSRLADHDYRDFVRKFCRKLTVMRFSWTLYFFLMRQHSIWMVNRYNLRIWGSQQPQEIVKHQRDMPNLNV
jgi:hypothetical protein